MKSWDLEGKQVLWKCNVVMHMKSYDISYVKACEKNACGYSAVKCGYTLRTLMLGRGKVA
jgi:hypothetical protein